MRRPALDADRIRELASPDMIREQATASTRMPYRLLPIGEILPDPLQPRQTFDPEYIDELRQSIVENGLLQPVTVRRKAGTYLLVAGECRHRAARLAGLSEMPCLVREMDDRTAAIVALVENVQRQDLNPIDLARHLRRLHNEFGLDWTSVAAAVGKSVPRVKALAGLLEMPEELRTAVRTGRVSADTAREIARIPDPSARQELVERAAGGDLTQARARELVNDRLRVGSSPSTPGADFHRHGNPSAVRRAVEAAETLAGRLRALDAGPLHPRLAQALEEVEREIERLRTGD